MDSTFSVEDWFDDEATEAEDLEFSRLQQSIWKEGYKQGIHHAKDAGLQKGFEEGFGECAELCLKLGEIRGNLRALQQFSSTFSAAKDLTAIDELLAEVDQFSVKSEKITFQQHPQNLSEFVAAASLNRANLIPVIADLIARGSVILDGNKTS